MRQACTCRLGRRAAKSQAAGSRSRQVAGSGTVTPPIPAMPKLSSVTTLWAGMMNESRPSTTLMSGSTAHGSVAEVR